jgi:hypothetical protein
MSEPNPERTVYRSLEEFDRRFFPKPIKGLGSSSSNLRKLHARATRDAIKRVQDAKNDKAH